MSNDLERATVESWKQALDTMGVRYETAPRFVPAGTAALLVVGYGAKKGTVVFFETGGAEQLGSRALSEGFGFAAGFEFDDPADLVEVREEWGVVDNDEPPA